MQERIQQYQSERESKQMCLSTTEASWAIYSYFHLHDVCSYTCEQGELRMSLFCKLNQGPFSSASGRESPSFV